MGGGAGGGSLGAANLTAIVDRNGLQQFALPSSEETALTDRGDRRDPCSGSTWPQSSAFGGG